MIREITSKRDLKKFIKLPWKIYQKDKSWCPPFLFECKKMFSGKHPFYEYGEMALFLAEREGEVVGRIAAIKNGRYNAQHQDKTGFFGFFEAIDDQAVANALLDGAKKWLKEKGYDRMVGPASPSANYEYGCQISGFEHDQVFLSMHNAPYYAKLYENYGLSKAIDMYAYRATREKISNSPILKALTWVEAKYPEIKIRGLDIKNARQEIFELTKIFNLCWANNHGFVPISDAESEYLYSSLKPFLNSDLIHFAEVEGKIVGGAIFLLDYNQLFKTMDGRLFPLNIFKIFTQKKKITWMRSFMAGVLPEYRNKAVFPLMLSHGIKRGMRFTQLDFLEASYVLENNHQTIAALEKLGAEIYKKYRLFETAC